MHEPRYAFVACETEFCEDASIIRIPLRVPVGGVSHRVRRYHETHGGGAGGKNLLPLRCLGMLARGRNHGDDQRRAEKSLPFGLKSRLGRIGMVGCKRSFDAFPETCGAVSCENDESPRNDAPVIGDAGRNC